MGKRAKGHDRDKYYHLAKDQGYRARSAFKLIEINKKHDFLSNARVVIDLCAAPGSWCQVAQKAMPSGGLVIGVDLLPIRPIRGVKTLISDITTEECRRLLHREMQTWKADAVLCDGAPNVGAAYSKDAYVQNEIALAALKVATQHLAKGGAFVTKVYRSQDYNALVWVLQHFFEEYHAVKPASSRSQSAEIFLVGLNYRDPASIDPKMLDPRAVFDQSHEESAKKGVTIFHKKFEQHNKRQRGGYDDDLGPTLSRAASVTSFIDSADPIRMLTDCNTLKFEEGCAVFRSSALTTPDVLRACEDLKVLGKADFKHLLKWRLKMREYRDELSKAGEADDSGSEEGEDDGDEGEEGKGDKEEALNSDEEEEQVQEEIRGLRLKVLAENKRRRKKEREAAARLRQRAAMGMESAAIELPEDEAVFTLASLGKGGTLQTLDELREANLGGMRASDVGCASGDEEDEENAGAAANSGDSGSEDEENEDGSDDDSGEDSDVEKNMQLEEELEAAYQMYLTGRNKESLEGTRTAKRTKLARANKAAAEQQEDVAMYNMDGDKHQYLKMLAGQDGSGADADSSDGDANDIDSSDEDDGVPNGRGGGGSSSAEEEEDDEGAAAAFDSDDADAAAAGEGRNPLLTDLMSDKARRKERTSRWFANPLFEGVTDAATGEAEQLLMLQQQQAEAAENGEAAGADSAAGAAASAAEQRLPKRQRREVAAAAAATRSKKAAAIAANALGTVSFGENDRAAAANSDDESDSDAGGAAAAVLASMPKSDKQLRKEKRKKALERRERKEARKHPELEEEQDLQVVAADDEMADMTPQQKARMLRKRELIRQGMGSFITDDASSSNIAAYNAGGGSSSGGGSSRKAGSVAIGGAALAGIMLMRGANGAAAAVAAGENAAAEELSFSTVPALERKDDRTYDSGSEGYDDEDRANQMALGTMMLRKHRQKALVDAAYNRYAWNDDKDLPSWFVDDEQKHYRPQLPIPKALLEQMKRKFLSLAAKPIKKVAEARLRKRKRATDKLKAARKKAEALAQNPDISERQKVKAVQQAMRRGGVSADKPSKVYVVSKKSGGTSGSSGSKAKGARVKMVDSRMKKDKRGEKRAAKRKGGKGGGGGKRRKH